MTERQGAGQTQGDGTSSALSPKYAAVLRRLQERQQDTREAKNADWVAALERGIAYRSDQDIAAAAIQHLQARFKKHGAGALRRADAVDVLWVLCGKKDTDPNDKETIKELIGFIAAGDEAHLLADEVRDALQLGLRQGKPFEDQYKMYRKRLNPRVRRPLKPLNSTHPAPLEANLDCARCGVKPDPYRGGARRLSCSLELGQKGGAPGQKQRRSG